MNDNAKKLIAALRSGEFDQIKRKLHTKYGYCCLGVACELAVREGVIPPGVPDEANIYYYEENSSSLPWSVQRWLGFSTGTGAFWDSSYDGGYPIPQLGAESLAALNDAGWTFEKIADLIESEPKGLFRE